MWNTVLNKSIESSKAGIYETKFYEKLRGEKLSIFKKVFVKTFDIFKIKSHFSMNTLLFPKEIFGHSK